MSKKIIINLLLVSVLGVFVYQKLLIFKKIGSVQKVISPFSSSPSLRTNAFTPFLSIDTIFNSDHAWVATLSAKNTQTLIATGDVIPARSVNAQAIQRNNFKWPFEKTADILKNADITLINLESPLFTDCNITNEGMSFCGSSRHIEGLKYAGVDVAGFANNHMGNYGEKGVESTKELLSNAGILAAGILGPVYKDVRGIRFAFLGYNDIADGKGLISRVDEETIHKEVTEAKQQADIVIVQFHWGIEYVTQPSQRQKDLGYLAVESGADLVIGNHPHWIQPIEFYKSKLITYAHGNFVFDQMWSEKTKEGVVGKYTFYDKKLIDAEYFPIKIIDYGQPYFLEGSEKQRILEEMKNGSIELSNNRISP